MIWLYVADTHYGRFSKVILNHSRLTSQKRDIKDGSFSLVLIQNSVYWEGFSPYIKVLGKM